MSEKKRPTWMIPCYQCGSMEPVKRVVKDDFKLYLTCEFCGYEVDLEEQLDQQTLGK